MYLVPRQRTINATIDPINLAMARRNAWLASLIEARAAGRLRSATWPITDHGDRAPFLFFPPTRW